MGMNELGPRRCPLAFVSVILNRDVTTKTVQRRSLDATHLERMNGRV